ncbi:ATP-binding protein [Pseudoflavitalea sp. G-6-1-2]|uniref:ATP-binding protein n=1 Tax=Pseudoflavitalea sp. G-6-1-2 TaxID=2728841 RepID=UPI00146D3A28|nr:ATP-binding protein [Pseudoflavitalea sp. G-6-1-2]NML19476.1 ATP-binding protein [Pseudoflavitalea sp. G-6-1-2]
MIRRRLEARILSVLRRSPAMALTGPRQVGKTTLALDIGEKIPAIYLDLENRLDLQKVSNIEAFHEENRDKLIILDEVQRTPEIFAPLRGIIDKERRKGNKSGHFLFLGSASMVLLRQSGESLAGRIAYSELFPIDVLEYANNSEEKLNSLWVRGGFPESLLADSDENSLAWRLDFIKTYLERDIPQLGPRIPARTLERLWTMLAHNQGGILNSSQLARNLEVSSPTVHRYLDLMVDLLLIRRLEPWFSNIGKRLVRAPKIYIRDSGITHALLNIKNYNELLGHPVVGTSWETFVIENIFSVLPVWCHPFFYRSPGGAEIDLILEFGGKEKWAIEVKRKTVPVVSKGFHIGCEDIKADRKFVVYSGQDRFSMGNDITAIPLHELMQLLLDEKSSL